MGATAALSKEIEYGSDRQNGTLVSLIDYYDSKLSSISTRAVDKLGRHRCATDFSGLQC